MSWWRDLLVWLGAALDRVDGVEPQEDDREVEEFGDDEDDES
jgi:hypothetical protein